MSDILPALIQWTPREDELRRDLLAELDRMLLRRDGRMSMTGTLVQEALGEVCNPLLTPDQKERGRHWRHYRDGDKPMSQFFAEWLEYAPTPKNPGKYIDYWDYLANTAAGMSLNNDDALFKRWFVRFLDMRGRWLNTTASASTISRWMDYDGTDDHPFDIDEYKVPKTGFESFNQFFLRNIKWKKRPLCADANDPNVVVAPCDGGIFYLTRGELEPQRHLLPGKSQDTFQLLEALPGYGGCFLGGPLLDMLLWFTDYHHFGAPVSGKIVHQGVYEGSYNYDFDDFDAEDPYAPPPPDDSDRVGWYENLGKHKRYVWIFKTESLGLVAMVAIGFWGVGSITSTVSTGDHLEKGDLMGHFGYGGSSIVLAFEPELNLDFSVDGTAVTDADHPVLMKIRQCIGLAAPKHKDC